MFKKYPALILFSIISLALASCAPAPTPVVSIETIVAATYSASVAQTEAARPPNTPTPILPTATRTCPPSTDTPTPTATFIIASITPTFTPTATVQPTATTVTSGSGNLLYSCNILSMSPRDKVRVSPKESIRWIWQIENSGTTRWDPDDVGVRFSSGDRLSSKNAFSIDGPAKPGQNTTAKLTLYAPKEPGTYITTWSLRKDIHYFCYATLEVEVYE